MNQIYSDHVKIKLPPLQDKNEEGDIDQFITANLEAYQRACEDGSAETDRWRLMVLGCSGDGKTSLIDRLLGRGFNEQHIVTNALRD